MPDEFLGFWRDLRAGFVSFPKCDECSRFHWYPMKRCPHCLSENIVWKNTSGIARLHSWTVVRHRFDPDTVQPLPYMIGLLEFADAPGVRLIGNIVDCGPEMLEPGMTLRAVITSDVAGDPSLAFRPGPAVRAY